MPKHILEGARSGEWWTIRSALNISTEVHSTKTFTVAQYVIVHNLEHCMYFSCFIAVKNIKACFRPRGLVVKKPMRKGEQRLTNSVSCMSECTPEFYIHNYGGRCNYLRSYCNSL